MNTQTKREKILATLKARGAMTRKQLADATGITLQSVCGRVNELMHSHRPQDGFVVVDGYTMGEYGVLNECVKFERNKKQIDLFQT